MASFTNLQNLVPSTPAQPAAPFGTLRRIAPRRELPKRRGRFANLFALEPGEIPFTQTFQVPRIANVLLGERGILQRYIGEPLLMGGPGALPRTVGELTGLDLLKSLRRGKAPTPAIAPPAETLSERIAKLPRAEGGVLLQKAPQAPRIGPTPPGVTAAPKGLVSPVLNLGLHKKVTGAAQELFVKAGVQRSGDLLISDQITDLLVQNRIPLPELQATLTRHGLSVTEFASGLFRPGIRDAARRLQALSAVQRQINALMASSPNEAARIRELASEVDEVLAAKSLWKSGVGVWRGLLVSQPATAARNLVVSTGRLGLDVIEQGVNRGLQTVTGRPRTASPLEPLNALLNMFWRPGVARKQAEAILQTLPAEWDRMFGSFMSDFASKASQAGVRLGVKDRVIVGAENGVRLLNVFNRGQEFLVRRAVFDAHLAQRLSAGGDDLVRAIRENRIAAVDEADIAAAVGKALEFTFARHPQRGSLGYHFVRLVNGLGPLVAPAIPFPRFLMDSFRFYYEYSPFGILRLLAPAERTAMAAGNFSAVSRAVVGTGLLGAAYAFRASEHAGERWYEARVGKRTIDLRPFNPFGPYLFVADLARRGQDGTLYKLDTKDVLSVIASANVRAGTGLYILDQVIDQFTSEGKAAKAIDRLKTVAGEFASGYLTPLQTVMDVMAEFDKSLGVIREQRVEPFLGPIKSRIPSLARQLPEAESPTRAGPMTRESPLLRQATGLSFRQEKNALEKELDRLQFTRSEILSSAGDPEADRLVAKHMGPLSEQILVPIVSRSEYRRLSDAAKGEMLRRLLGVVRQQARARAQAENPQLFMRLRQEGQPARLRRLLEEAR